MRVVRVSARRNVPTVLLVKEGNTFGMEIFRRRPNPATAASPYGLISTPRVVAGRVSSKKASTGH